METINASREELEKKAANIIASKLNEKISSSNKAVLGICGGSSVENIFKHLLDEDIKWNKVHIFLVDERCVSLNSLESNYRLAYNAFIKPLIDSSKLPKENAHAFMYDEANAVKSLRRYNNELSEQGGKFDVILLSSGEDGHVAALYPKHRSITNEAVGFFTLNDSPKPPKQRMTSSRKLLQKSSVAILLFLGKEKQNAYQKFIAENTQVHDCPAKLITSINDSYVLVST